MKKTKVTVSAVLALLIIFSLAACSRQSDAPEASESALESQTAEYTAETTVEETTEPTEPNSEYIKAIEANMSLEEKVGQMFFVNCPDENAVESITKYRFGGFVLFSKDFDGKTAGEIQAEIQSYQSNSKIPMLFGVDEEGGEVVRVSSNPKLRETPFLSPKEYYKEGGMKAVINAENEKADLLLSLGINVNLAPVCDVTKDEASFMYSRSFSDNTDKVSEYVTKTVEAYNAKGLGSVLKHFPGYGENTDTHTGSSVDNRSYAELANNDFLPFEAGIKAGAQAVMVSHSIVNSIDPDFPASLSDKVHQVIRKDLNFKGVIMSDDLVMDAVSEYIGTENAAVAAVKGGNDILCCSDFEAQYPAVLAAVQNGEIPEEQIDQSVMRILKWKQSLGILGF